MIIIAINTSKAIIPPTAMVKLSIVGCELDVVLVVVDISLVVVPMVVVLVVDIGG